MKKEKYEKVLNIFPDIAVIQESVHVDKLKDSFRYHDAIWAGKEEGIGLGVFSFSKDINLTMLIDEIKYEWIVPIKVSGKADFVLIAVWTKRIPGLSYGKLLYSALEEYEHFLRNNRVIIVGDFNLDKKLPASYAGIQGIQGFDRIIDLFRSYGMESSYHYFYKESFGLESKATYNHHKKINKPFHIDYCFVSKEILQGTQQFYIGEGQEWTGLSDHFPLIMEADIVASY
jgi:exodeoxyribonuclease III